MEDAKMKCRAGKASLSMPLSWGQLRDAQLQTGQQWMLVRIWMGASSLWDLMKCWSQRARYLVQFTLAAK